MKRSGLLNVRVLALSLGLHPVTLYRLVEQGKIPFIKIGRGRIRFEPEAIAEWIEQKSFSPIAAADSFPQVNLSLANYDRLLLKGGVKLSREGKTWRYPFGSVFSRATKNQGERFYIYYRISGKRIRERVENAMTRADALKVLQVRVADAFRGKYEFKKEAGLRFKDFADEWLEGYSRTNKKSADRDGYSLDHLKPFFKDAQLAEISGPLVESYKGHRKSEKASNGTINRELACLRSILYKAVEWRKLESYPLSKRKLLLKENNQRDRILSDSEARRLIEAAKPHLRPILIVLLGTAMRKSEALGLRWENVDFRKGFVYVGGQDSKSGRSRTIPMSSLVFETLIGIKNESASEFVFTNPETKKNLVEIKRSFKTALRNAEIKGATLHTLRHTALSRMVEAGIDLVTVSKIAGHASIQMTMRYAHPTPENMRRAVEVLAQICPHSVPTEKIIPAEASVSHSMAVS